MHIPADELPTFDGEGAKGRLIAGSAFGLSSPLPTASDTLFCDVQLESGRTLQIDVDAEERALYTVDGTLDIDGNSFEPGRLIILSSSVPCQVKATSNARFVLMGGAAMEGPRYLWWNFVSSRPERIEQAKEDWKMRRFDPIPGDEDEFIPLPDDAREIQKAVGGVDYP